MPERRCVVPRAEIAAARRGKGGPWSALFPATLLCLACGALLRAGLDEFGDRLDAMHVTSRIRPTEPNPNRSPARRLPFFRQPYLCRSDATHAQAG
jgi:hypothetical protein